MSLVSVKTWRARVRAALGFATALALVAPVTPGSADPPTGDVGVRSQALYVSSNGGDSRSGSGPNWAGDAVGVNAADGNLVAHEIDDPIANPVGFTGDAVFSLDRWYNSRLQTARDVGKGWVTGLGYDVRLTGLSSSNTRFYTPSQHIVLFDTTGSGPFAATNDSGYDLTQVSGGWSLDAGPEGRTYAFDTGGKLKKITDLDSGLSERFDYTSAGGQDRLSAVYGPRETATRFSYNGNGQIIEADNPASQHGYYGYTGSKLSSATRPAGPQTIYTHDAGDRLNGATRPGYALTVTYDAQGRAATLSETRSGVTTTATFVYLAPQPGACDPARDASQTDVTSGGHTTSYCFDANGNVTAGAAEADIPEQAIDLDGRAWELGDVDSDGQMDVLLVNKLSGAVSARLGRPDHSFDPEESWGSFGGPIGALTLGDIDNFEDDDVDDTTDTEDLLGLSPGGSLTIRYSTGYRLKAGTQGGAGHQVTWPADRRLALADIDGDGQHDLWSVDPTSYDVHVALGGGDGLRDSSTWGSVSASVQALAGDLVDNDDHRDLVTYDPATGLVRVARAGDSSFGTFATRGTGPASADAVIGDLNGEGSADLYFRQSNGVVTARRTTQAGGMGPPIVLGTLPVTYAMSAHDLTGDGPLSVVGTRVVSDQLLIRGINVAAVYTGP